MYLFSQLTLNAQADVCKYYAEKKQLSYYQTAKALLKINPLVEWDEKENVFVMIGEADIRKFDEKAHLFYISKS